MKAQRLVSSQLPKYAYKKTTQKHVLILTHLHREFNVSRPNEVYIWTGCHWSYLTMVMDLHTRKPVGWAMSLSPDSQPAGRALSMTYERRGKPKNIMFYSD